MNSGPAVVLKNNTSSLYSTSVSNLSSKKFTSDLNQMKSDVPHSSCLSSTLFPNCSIHMLNSTGCKSNFTKITNSTFTTTTTTTATTTNNNNNNNTITNYRLTNRYRMDMIYGSDTLLHSKDYQHVYSIEHLMNHNSVEHLKTYQNASIMEPTTSITIKRRLPPLGKSDSSETDLQFSWNDNNLRIEDENKIEDQHGRTEGRNLTKININQYDNINNENGDKIKETFPESLYSSLHDVKKDKEVCFYCHNRLPSYTHQLNILPSSRKDNEEKLSLLSPSSTCSKYEIRPNTTGEISKYKNEYEDSFSDRILSNDNHVYTQNNYSNNDSNSSRHLSHTLYTENLSIVTTNHYPVSCITTNHNSKSYFTYPDLKNTHLSCNITTNSNNNNDNNNNNYSIHPVFSKEQQPILTTIRNSIPGSSILHGYLKTSISEASYKTNGNRGMHTVNQRTISVPTVSTNSCQKSLIQINKTTNSDGHCETITEDKNTGEITIANEVITRRSVNSNTASQIISDPRSRTCCFCWCCCCSCSCMRVRTNIGESKRPSASNDPQSTIDGPVTDERITLEEMKKWAESFDILMRSPGGQKMFREFLRSEYSEENIMFWLACEDIRKETNLEIVEEKARIIYEDFISILSPREVSLDSRVREIINSNMIEPTPHIFDEAQLQIYTLMHRDSYPRFLNSKLYKDMIDEAKDFQS
ncbi:unnamed protein product [Heterobilharzia americana]|nr:unnamed protein product [Heterobilharzia americana]